MSDADKDEKEGKEPPEHRGDEFLQTFKKGSEFTQDLLKENERLRYRIVELEEAVRASGGEEVPSKVLEDKVKKLEEEKEEILERIREVEAENQDFANRYVEVEEENNNLANLYIASYQLHSTLDFSEVLQIIMEIIINLVGAEIFGVLLFDEKSNQLTAFATEGMEKEDLPPVKIGEGIIGDVVKSGENYFKESLAETEKIEPLHPMVCIPLKIKERVIGVIVIYKLLQQKDNFRDVDYELFTLLAGHAATAIFGSKLYSESERKLSTIQGFMDLLTK
ncbi:MAG: GAF domain-containing protein [Deltaproteobacteria bacterium]|nr:GAF domain-containing protein [Deltaproteobacteria bacterium]